MGTRCLSCGIPLLDYDPYTIIYGRRSKKKKPPELTADGQPPTKGNGNNCTCNNKCANILLVRMITSIPNVLDLLPPIWRPDIQDLADNPKLLAKKEKLAKAKRRAARHKADMRRRWRALGSR